jgi:EAL domain-containing protein (putative c-di-GMP-specific phosphodiesterase class I)/GGDEF domain-containing protein
MSLLKRLWLSIGVLLLTVFTVTLAVFGLSGSATLEEQLRIKTENTTLTTAQFLAIEAESLGLDRLDSVIPELRLKSLTDLGEFQTVELRDPSGATVFKSENSPPPTQAPEWFKRIFAVETYPFSQPVMLGWDNWELSLTAFGGSAYDELWRASKRSAFAMLAAFLVAGFIGQIILSRLLQPLDNVVSQAAAIGQRRFSQIAVPTTTEFAAVAKSMNELSERVQSMLSDEAVALKNKKETSDLDETTRLLNRDTFIDQLATKLSRENEEALGSIALIRILGLADMNRDYGRFAIDNLLMDVGSALNSLRGEDAYGAFCSIGRMNGADVCAIATNETNAKNLADIMQRSVRSVLEQHGIDPRYAVAASCIEYQYGDGIGDLLTAMDSALAQSELQAGVPVVPAELSQSSSDARATQIFWQQHLADALTNNQLTLSWYPVKAKNNDTLHLEGMARLAIGTEEFNAGQFLPWVFRLGLAQAFDKAVVDSAIEQLDSHDGQRLHVNLSAESVRGNDFCEWLNQRLESSTCDITKLGFELSESAVLVAKDNFGQLVATATQFGCQVGIEHMGYRPEIIAELGKLGPSYLKIDSLYTQMLTTNEGNRAVVSSLSGVARSLGVNAIAEGISTLEDRDAVFELGAKGASGRAIE